MSDKAGLPPGSLIHVGARKSEKSRLSIIRYTKDSFEELVDCNISQLSEEREKGGVLWVNVDGVHDVALVEQVGKQFNLHSLVLEDILNTHQRPKLEELDEFFYLNLKMVGIDKKRKGIVIEQVGFILGKNVVLSFQERQGDLFDLVRSRLREAKGVSRSLGADFLFYRLVDTIVDNYFVVAEFLSDKGEKVEEKVLQSATSDSLQEIQELKKILSRFRRIVVPLREPIAALYKEPSPIIQKTTRPYLRDVSEHLIQVAEYLEVQRETAGGLTDLYHSSVSQRMNQVMQVLTIISTIFIPLTFIAGIYGMNFDVMPELKWPYGYLIVWVIMIVLAGLMIVLFKRKKWL